MKNNTPMSGTVELGDEVEDKVTGVRGIAVARTRWMTGCDRITVQGRVKDGKAPDLVSFDEPMLKILKRGKVARPQTTAVVAMDEVAKPGGPRPTPSQR